MTISVLFLIVAALLFLMSTVPKITRSWMIGVGLALLAASLMPYFTRHIG
jgi:hypothetical protein